MAYNAAYWRGYFLEYDENDNTVVHRLSFDNINHSTQSIQGRGKHPSKGIFNLKGTSQNGNIQFTLTFEKENKTLFFEGNSQENVLQGSWGEDEDCCKGGWKFTHVVPKKGWNGSYEQNKIDYDMHFETFKIEGGNIEGKGTDQNGAFTIKGTISPNNQAKFTKTYEHETAWQYWGDFKGSTIEGSWGADDGDAMGSFLIFYHP